MYKRLVDPNFKPFKDKIVNFCFPFWMAMGAFKYETIDNDNQTKWLVITKETKAQKKSNQAETRHGTEQKWNDTGIWFLNLNVPQNHLDSLLKHKLPGSTPRVSDLKSLRWGLRVSISNKFPEDADPAGLGLYFKNKIEVDLGQQKGLIRKY